MLPPSVTVSIRRSKCLVGREQDASKEEATDAAATPACFRPSPIVRRRRQSRGHRAPSNLESGQDVEEDLGMLPYLLQGAKHSGV
jgi:hypothetical protein